MEKVQIKNTDLKPSQLCLGGGVFCDSSREKECFYLLDYFFERGGNFVDTANIYGKWLKEGTSSSEIMIGNWMKSRNNSHKMVVTTKGAHPHLATMHISRLAKAELQADIEESLQSMQVEKIDLYWLHRDDVLRPVEDIIESLNEFIQQGKIGYIGTSNWTAARIKEANEYAKSKDLQGFAANQPLWSLARADMNLIKDKTLTNMDEAMLALHKESCMAAIPYSSQASGFFQKLSEGKADSERFEAYNHAENIARLPKLEKLEQEKNKSVNQIALAYLLNQPFTTIPIVGCTTVEKLEESMGATDIVFTNEQLQYLEGTESRI